ncbi:DUF1566 domain-containing protein [bacterium]|nr:DUF1566 domain-containing protein [bacterium]
MKIFFSIMLIFLFLSCGGGKKTPESVVPDEDFDQDIDIVDVDDDEFVEDEESDDENMPDADIENETDPAHDADEETEIIPDPCETEPCKGVENSTEKCLSSGNRYVCECVDSYVWQGIDIRCVEKKLFRGTVCTGQKKCYDMEKEIPCPKEGEPFYGQDAQYAEMEKCLLRSYTIKQYDDGETVIDNNTGLEWERQSSVENRDVNWSSYAGNHCNWMHELGGYNDWKAPTVSEFYSLVDIGTDNPAIDEFYFPDTPSAIFLTRVYYEPAGHSAITHYEGVDFANGTAVVVAPSSDSEEKMRFRCVRPSDREPPYCHDHLFSGDGYEIRNDARKRLIFKVDPVSGKNWKEALEYCEKLTYAGISDWRVPNRNEMSDLYFTAWSSSSVVSDPKSAWILDYAGNFSRATKSNTGSVYCVASEPCGEKELWTGEKCIPFSALFLKDDGCLCMDGYGYDYDSGSGECVEQCTDDMCKDAEHSTGRCTNNNVRSYCQCEENFYYTGEKCDNRCEEFDPGSDGTVTSVTDFFGHTCGCKEGYFHNDEYNYCYLVGECDYRFPCKNSASGIMWAVTAQRYMKWERAKKYCEELDYLGYTNWRLPNIDELRSSIHARCEKTVLGGICEVSENKGCLSQECMTNCNCSSLTEEEHSGLDFIWSSSLRSDTAAQVFVLYSDVKARSILSVDPANTFGRTSCVRDIK